MTSCIFLEMQQVELVQVGLQPIQNISTIWLSNIQQGKFKFNFVMCFVWGGCVEGERGLGECIQLVLSQATPLSPPCLGVSTSCHVCPCSAWLWCEPTMFYILYFCLSIVLISNGFFCLILLVQLFVENITCHLCC